jgi:glycosyltransferase involved in cell wall biosynthesis
LSEESFNLAEVQQAIGSKLVHVREILESKIESSGKIVWVPKIKKDGSNVEESKISLELDRSSPYVGEGLECFWEGPTFDAGGYANMNRQYIMNLTRLGVSVRPSVMATGDQIEKPLRDAISGLFSASVSPNSPKVFSTNIPSRHSGLSISYTMMETERKVHKDLVTHMGVADELWVPSDWNKEMFVNGGVNKKITVMPLGIDSEMYKPRSPKIIFKCGVKSFVFLGVSTWLWRKGYDVLLKAYSRAFTSDDDVSLVVFTRVPLLKGAHYDRIYSDIVQMVGGTKSTFPHLVVVPSILPSKAMPYLYNSVDAFALFSRGEGWGLPYCEATASGIPVIGADHGGQKMFLNNDNSFLVKPDKVSPCHSSLLPISPFYHGMHFADYSESAIDEAAEKMRYVFEHQEEAKEKAAICRANLLENFTWQKSACRVADRLKELK